MPTTSDSSDPRLTHGADEHITRQADAYLVLSPAELAKGFVRPVIREYEHQVCETRTTMSLDIAQTYARQPDFYGSTWCMVCMKHRPVDEFHWVVDGKVTSLVVGS